MCDTQVKKEWPYSVTTAAERNLAAERSRAYRQRLKLKREIEKCFPNAEYLEKKKAKTATERIREYRPRRKTKRESDRCTVEASEIYVKPDIKTIEEQQRDYRQRLKLKRALKKLDTGGSMLNVRLDKVTETATGKNEESRPGQELIFNQEKNCDRKSMSVDDSRQESPNIVQGNQVKELQRKKECNVEKSCKGESTIKEYLKKDRAKFIKQNLDYARSVLKQSLNKSVKQSPISEKNVRTYNSSAEYFFHLMIEQ